MLKDKYIDLHVHSVNSDGSYTPKQLINMAKENGVKILSIADHDSIGGLKEFKQNIFDSMYGVSGIEFSSYIIDGNEKNKIHILGYCYDDNIDAFKTLVNEMVEKRKNAHLEYLKNLSEKIHNLPNEKITQLNISKYCWFDREIINYLKINNYPTSLIEEAKEYSKLNRFNYGSDYEIEAKKVIDAIHSAGGYVIFAHPMAYNFSGDKEKVMRIIKKLSSMGIDGVEIYQSDCSFADSLWLKKIVEDNQLLFSVGSDFHRTNKSDGRQVGLGINNNLCIAETSLTNEIVRKKLYIRRDY